MGTNGADFTPRDLRLLRGARGHVVHGNQRFFNVPGVVYPQEVLRRGVLTDEERFPKKAPKGWLCTEEVRVRFFDWCSAAAMRMRLERGRVRHVIVHEPGQVPRAFWCTKQVEAYVERMELEEGPLLRRLPSWAIMAVEAQRVLRVCRSSLLRYAARGIVREFRCRLVDARKGVRKVCYYCRAEVERKGRMLEDYRAALVRLGVLKKALLTPGGVGTDTENESHNDHVG